MKKEIRCIRVSGYLEVFLVSGELQQYMSIRERLVYVHLSVCL